ncbi:MAG: hypothetical protein AVDCRST_MAG75-799 [uncultured Propionibacteriaceae bacterium]|uniref:Aminoglycoside phosphotransferase domain-containing protein n=1 Tax=uncultured Propionibacteriaceae bacterium TaxID=257457 RepID=A0A6J4N6I8_9ACTN|nr:MAG: hypothetical protein AVDCRST_MAG75-799 [uncultured Propionibacteriaceae bacterium]
MVSCTRWLQGTVAGSGPIENDWLATSNAAALARLHAAQAPRQIPVWRRLVEDDFCDRLEQSLRRPWTAGPYGEQARRAIAARISDIRRWTASYHRLCRRASDSPWVPTHGEPHTANQVITESGVVFVDWETVALAPRERDLRTLVDSGYADLVAPDWAMIAMFDVEWRLDELSQYSTWFASPHRGTESDRVALEALFEELDRPDVFAD